MVRYDPPFIYYMFHSISGMFLAPFQEVQFWSMKEVYFLQNANNLNCYSILCINNISYSIYSIFSPWLTLKSWIRRRKKVVQVAQMGGRWGGSNSGNERTAFFLRRTSPRLIGLLRKNICLMSLFSWEPLNFDPSGYWLCYQEEVKLHALPFIIHYINCNYD